MSTTELPDLPPETQTGEKEEMSFENHLNEVLDDRCPDCGRFGSHFCTGKPLNADTGTKAHVMCPSDRYQKLLDDSRMLKALIAAGARGTKIWNKAAKLIRLDFGQ